MLFKGCIDGSGEHPQFRNWETYEKDDGVDWSQLLTTWILPLCLEADDGKEIWFNEKTGGTQFLRSMKIQHCGESREVVLEQYRDLLNVHEKVLVKPTTWRS